MNSTPLQINIELWQFIIGAVVFVFTVGGSWFLLKYRVNRLEKDVEKLDRKFDSNTD